MIEWNDKFSVNVSIIDEEHKKLIDIINKAFVAKQHGSNPEEILEILNDLPPLFVPPLKLEFVFIQIVGA